MICLLILLVPIRYKFDGGYETSLQAYLWVRFIAFLTIEANWDSASVKPGRVKIGIAGISFYLHPEKWKDKEQKPDQKDKDGFPSAGLFLRGLDRELLGNGAALFVDMLKMLRPDKIALRGRVGFDEPHLTGWLTAFGYVIKGFSRKADFFIEPVWHDEYYEINMKIEGKIVIVLLFLRVARFMFSRRTRQFLKLLKKERAAHAA